MTDCLRPDITEYLRWRLQLELGGISRGKRVAAVHALSLHTRQDGGIVLSSTLRGQVRHNVVPESVYEHPRYALASEAPQHFRDAPLEALVAQSLVRIIRGTKKTFGIRFQLGRLEIAKR